METATRITPAPAQRRELVELPISELVLDPIINRTVDPRWVDRLAEAFNPLALGLFTCWTDNGIVKLVDGQHRKLAAEKVGHDERVPCYVYHGLSEPDAAELFLQINSQRNVSTIDKFRKAVQAEHVDELAVARVLASYELQVGYGPEDVGAPMVLLGIYRRGGEDKLRQYIDLLLGVYPDMPRGQALHGELLSALLKVERAYARVKQELDWEHLAEALATISMIEFFAERDLKHRQAPQHTKAWHTGWQIVELYNQGRRGAQRLKLWGEVVG